MKAFFLKHKKKHLCVLINLVLLAAFWLTHENRRLMTFLAENVTVPLRRALGKVSYLVDFSVMEALCIVMAAALVGYLVWSVVAVCRAKGRRRQALYGVVLGVLCMGLSAGSATCFLLGIDSFADGFQEKSGVYAQPVAIEDLLNVTVYFAVNLAEAADDVARDENGLFAVPREEILASSTKAYTQVEKEFPFLAFEDPGVKPLRFSRVMSAMDFTGMYCPFTGESNVNMDSPACLLASTVCHELAHQRGVTSEQECNFLAVLASTTCGDPTYAYAGWLMGYIHLGNALYRVSEDLYWALREALPETVNADLAAQSAYWEQFRDKTPQKVSNQVYDNFLKVYGQEMGIQSYGTVVDMLVAYYREKI